MSNEFTSDVMSPLSQRLCALIRQKIFVFLVIFALHGAYILHEGYFFGWDAGKYSEWGDRLVGGGFNYSVFRHDRPLLFLRLGFITVVAIAKVLCGAYWRSAIVLLNLVSESIVGVLLVALILTLTRSTFAAWCGLGLFLIQFDIFDWTRHVISDTTFLLVSFSTFALLVHVFRRDRAAEWGWVIVLALITLVYRPTGFLLLPMLLLGSIFWVRAQQPDSPLGRMRIRRQLLILSVGFVVFALFLNTYFVQDPSRWPIRSLAKEVQLQARGFAKGEVIAGQPETYREPPDRISDYLLITGVRFVRFFQFTFRGFSARHNLLNSLFFLPVYAFALLGVYWLFSKKGPVARENKLIFLSFVNLAVFAFFHALVYIDSALRYRLPVLPHLIILASVGIARVFDSERLETTASPENPSSMQKDLFHLKTAGATSRESSARAWLDAWVCSLRSVGQRESSDCESFHHRRR